MCFSVSIQRDLKLLIKELDCLVDKSAFEKYQKQQELFPQNFRSPDEDNRIFPNTFAPVMVSVKGQRVLRPMRYRLRPADSLDEIPPQFNVFNARRDSLLSRKSWRGLIGRQHGLFPFTSFYEWVERDGKKRLINFSPDSKSLMWAPCLWDFWKGEGEEKAFYSFALITDEPAPEVQEAGHDRTPIFLHKDQINSWLNCRDAHEAVELLDKHEDVYFNNALMPEKPGKVDSQLKLL